MRILLPLVMLLTAACSPLSVTFTLGDRPGKLSETKVMTRGDRPRDAKVALIDVRGTIIDGPQEGFLTTGPSPVDDLVAKLAKAEKDYKVKAVILRINSPGGSVTASDIMYGEIERFRERTGHPVVALFGEVAASGGYFISLAADEIVTHPTTITGSVGVIFPSVNVSGGLNRIGIVSRSITSGAKKDMLNPLESMDPSDYELVQHMVDEMYGRFHTLVLDRRNPADTEVIEQYLDGRIMTGTEAVRIGLADHEGDVRLAMDRAMELAGIGSASLIRYHRADSNVRSVYSQATTAETDHAELSIFGVRLTDPRDLPAGMYYLWLPGM